MAGWEVASALGVGRATAAAWARAAARGWEVLAMARGAAAARAADWGWGGWRRWWWERRGWGLRGGRGWAWRRWRRWGGRRRRARRGWRRGGRRRWAGWGGWDWTGIRLVAVGDGSELEVTAFYAAFPHLELDRHLVGRAELECDRLLQLLVRRVAAGKRVALHLAQAGGVVRALAEHSATKFVGAAQGPLRDQGARLGKREVADFQALLSRIVEVVGFAVQLVEVIEGPLEAVKDHRGVSAR